MGLICLWTDTSVQATVAGIGLPSEKGRGGMGHRGPDRRAAAVRGRDELMGRPNGRDPGELAGLRHDYRDAWGIDPPDTEGGAWIATARRNGFPQVAASTLPEFRAKLEAAARAAGLGEMRDLEDHYQDWHVWRSSDRAWWASRKGGLAAEQLNAGLHATVGNVKRPPQLRALLDEQARIKAWAADHDWQIPGPAARRMLGLPAESAAFVHIAAPRSAPDDT